MSEPLLLESSIARREVLAFFDNRFSTENFFAI